MRSKRTRDVCTAALASFLACVTGGAAVRAAEALPVDPAVMAKARTLKSLPCAGGGKAGGFAADEGAPAAWHVAGTLVSVRRQQGDRIAFVLAPSADGSTECAVRDVIVLPRGGTLLSCALQDDSVRGLGVHAMLPSGRRDLLFWRVDAAGALRRQGTAPDDDDFESDTGELICALPDAGQ